jgi:hypothetical protein
VRSAGIGTAQQRIIGEKRLGPQAALRTRLRSHTQAREA